MADASTLSLGSIGLAAPSAPKLATAAKAAYWIVGVLVLFLGCAFVYNKMQRPVAALLIFLGGVMALYFYYVKWFVVAAMRPSWPPYQTPCPDYLTMISPGFETDANGNRVLANGGKYKCVDFVGVSRNGMLEKADPAALAVELAEANKNRKYIEINPAGTETKEQLKARIASLGLTWTSLFGDN